MARINILLGYSLAKPSVFFVALLPLAWLVYAAVFDQLGANPAEALIRSTGDWAIRMLCVVLAITPLRITTGIHRLAAYRRMAGLFVYFYAVVHLLAYAWFDMSFEVAEIAVDIAKRPFILVGFFALLALTLLAATSFNWAIRTIGAKRWQLLHRLVYVVAVLSVIHFFWMRASKNSFADVAVYAAILGSLLCWRAVRLYKRRRAQV